MVTTFIKEMQALIIQKQLVPGKEGTGKKNTEALVLPRELTLAALSQLKSDEAHEERNQIFRFIRGLGLANTYREADEEKGIAGEKAGLLLVRADMAGLNFTRTNLSEINLTDAVLRDANFTGAGLRDANITGADLWDANFTRAYLGGANFTGACGPVKSLKDAHDIPEELKNLKGCYSY